MGGHFFTPFILAPVPPLSLVNLSQVFIRFFIASAHLFTPVYHCWLRFLNNKLFVILVVVSDTLMICLAYLVILICFRLAEVVGNTVDHPLFFGSLLILRVTVSITLL